MRQERHNFVNLKLCNAMCSNASSKSSNTRRQLWKDLRLLVGVVAKGGLVGGLVKGCICSQLLRRLSDSASAANVGGWKR